MAGRDVLSRWRAELEEEPVTPADERDLIVAAVEHDLKSAAEGLPVLGGPAELHGALAERVSREQVERAVVAATRANVRRVMRSMGFTDHEAEVVAESVRIVGGAMGGEVEVTFEAPERVVAFMAAVREGDLERADLILHAREG